MSIFRFKQFAVDQTHCAMKVNTDGVLLGALAGAGSPQSILDIGTGTGVVALMLAQRFADARINAVEIDELAALTAATNFANSPFADRVKGWSLSFQQYFENHHDKTYDLVVSNPPFYINALTSPGKAKTIAKHADAAFFEQLLCIVPKHLNPGGQFALILPGNTADLVGSLAAQNGLHLVHRTEISSYPEYPPHRQIVVFSNNRADLTEDQLVIYAEPQKYTAQYRTVLLNFLTIF